MTIASAAPGVVRLLLSQLAAFLGLLCVASAVHKWLRWGRTRRVVHEFAGVPRAAAATGVAAVGLGELMAGALLFFPAYRQTGGLLAALIWGAYLALILRAIAQDRRDVDCGCSFGSTAHSLGAYDVARNFALVACALLVALSAASGAVRVPASQVLAACALLVLYGALDQVMALQPLRRGAVS